MKKPLTKEEFLERKNSELHKELLSVFKAKQDNDTISLWFRNLEKLRPDLHLCRFMGQPKVKFKVTYNYQAVFINMCEALQNGIIIVKDDKDSYQSCSVQQKIIIRDFSEKGFSIIKEKKVYLKDVGHLCFNDLEL